MNAWTRWFVDRTYFPRVFEDRDAKSRQAQREEAEALLADTQARRDEVAEVVEALRDQQARNHFGEAIEKAMLRKERRT